MSPKLESMQTKYVKITIYVPASHGYSIRKALAKSGAGDIGNYDCCSFTVKGIGRFRAKKGSRPFVGRIGKIEKVAEERIETICPKKRLSKVLEAIKNAHPYEEPAIDIYPLLNE